MLDPKLHGKRALITGGATGIGLGIAKMLAREGVCLAIASRHPDPAGIECLQAVGTNIVPIAVDVSSEEGVVRMFEEASEGLGGLDIFVNNAAMTRNEAVTRITADAFGQVFGTNTMAAVLGCREAARRFIAQKSGCILIVGSTSRMTRCYGDLSYRVSKTALKPLMEQMALELAPHHIRANLLTPGHFPTRLTSGLTGAAAGKLRAEIPLRRFGDPMEELGAAAVLLLSDHLSGYTTGTELVVDGGLALRPINFWTDDELLALNNPP